MRSMSHSVHFVVLANAGTRCGYAVPASTTLGSRVRGNDEMKVDPVSATEHDPMATSRVFP